jgi:hypothetical protein
MSYLLNIKMIQQLHNRNIVESGVQHHKPKPKLKISVGLVDKPIVSLSCRRYTLKSNLLLACITSVMSLPHHEQDSNSQRQ